MSDWPIASEGTSAPEDAASKVSRTELNPVDFLRRAAYVYPEKIAVVDGDRALLVPSAGGTLMAIGQCA